MKPSSNDFFPHFWYKNAYIYDLILQELMVERLWTFKVLVIFKTVDF